MSQNSPGAIARMIARPWFCIVTGFFSSLCAGILQDGLDWPHSLERTLAVILGGLLGGLLFSILFAWVFGGLLRVTSRR